MLGKPKILSAVLFIVAALAAPPGVAGVGDDDSLPDKSRYTLFSPTPRDLLRPFETDRPDKTEVPFTVDAGHFQIEMDVFSLTLDRHNLERRDTRVTAWAIGPVNLKLGLLNRVDLQLVIEPWRVIRIEDRFLVSPASTRQSGYGATTTRLKVNLWGNDGGPTALALLPFVTFPTSQDGVGPDNLAGGLVLPFAWKLPHGFAIGLNTGAALARPQVPGAGWQAEMINSAALSRDIIGPWGAYLELWTLVSTTPGAMWAGTFDIGFNLLLRENLKFDFGVNIGVTRSAPDWQPFLGLSWRY